jgi:UDP-N-acetyl-D-mannosaminuronic acid dehydrogenase
LLREVVGKSLKATLDPSCIKAADAVITVVGTPVDRHLNPTVSEVYHSIDALLDHMREGTVLILRSTVYPGVTKLVHERLRRLNRKVLLAFCPERIAEGNAIEELVQLPQIVSGFEPDAIAAASQIFGKLAPTLIELTPPEAELAKLFTNSWRSANFAISNQFYMLAESRGLDFYRIHDAVTRDYPRMRSFARAGFAAGPCLLKDTLQLAAFSQNNFFLGHAAMLVNEGLPMFLVEQLRPLTNKRVAILGMAFKAESDDKRDSLSFKLKKLVEVEALEVFCTDPYLKESSFVPLEVAVAKADIIIIGAPHNVYRDIEIPEGKVVVDPWNFLPARALASTTA